MKKLLVVLAVVSTVTYAGYRVIGGGDEAATPADSEQLVLDRIWIDHLPKNDRDTIQVFAALDDESVGVFQAASSWKGAYEVFRFEARGNEIRVIYPQTNERETVKARGVRCNEKGMDFCLELEGSSRGVKRYYSRKGWEIERASSLDDVRARAESLVAN